MKRVHPGWMFIALSGLTAGLPGGSAHAQRQAAVAANPFIGSWQLNTGKSRPAAGEPMPTNLVNRIDRLDAAHVHWSTTITDAQGKKDVETFDTPGNGEFYSLNGYTMVAHTLNSSVLQSTFKEDSGETDVVTCTLNAGATEMTCIGAITHKDGSTARYTDVFTRV